MKEMRSIRSARKGLLKRPRIDALMAQGLQSALVTVVAGPGYGKTHAVATYVAEAPIRLAWIRCNRMDNLPERFWCGFVQALELEFPSGASHLRELGFPDTMAKQDAFLHILAEEVYTGSQAVFVADNYGVLQNHEIRHFFECIVEAALENFCLIVISNVKTDIDVVGLRGSSGVFHITAEELSFTPSETDEFLAACGVELPPIERARLESKAAGWPLAIHLAVVELCAETIPEARLSEKSGALVDRMFEREYYAAYPPPVQELLIKLSLFHDFSLETVGAVASCSMREALEVIRDNMFIGYDRSTKRYSFQNMYRRFLAERQMLIPEEERRHVYSVAADFYMAVGNTVEAIECYEKSGQQEKMLKALLVFAKAPMALSTGHASYLMSKLEPLPREALEKHPVIDYIKANMYIYDLQMDRSEEALRALERRLLRAEETAENNGVLGEVYALLGAIQMMRNKTCFGLYYKKACDYLPNGSIVKDANPLLIGNNNIFSLEDNRPGALLRMERALHEGIPYVVRATSGGAHGMQYLYSAEAAYQLGDFRRAQEEAYRAVYASAENDQHDLLCNAHMVLAEIACIQGHYRELTEHIFWIRDYVNGKQLVALFDLRDFALSWFYLKMWDWGKMANWIIRPQSVVRDQAPITFGRDRALYAGYLLMEERYAELLPLLERLEELYQKRGLWLSRLNVHLLRGYTYMKQKNRRPRWIPCGWRMTWPTQTES